MELLGLMIGVGVVVLPGFADEDEDRAGDDGSEWETCGFDELCDGGTLGGV